MGFLPPTINLCFRFQYNVGRTFAKIKAVARTVKWAAMLLVKDHKRVKSIYGKL